jgi:DNA repair photolyase
MENFLGFFPRISRNFSENMSENFLGIFPKLIPRNIHSKTPIFLRKNSELYLLWKFSYELTRNYSEFFPWNNSDILLVFS